MGYQNRLLKLQSAIARITNEEYDRYRLNENMKVRELLNRVLGRIYNRFNIELLHEEEYKKQKGRI